MKTIKLVGMTAVMALWGLAATAQTSETNFTFAVNQAVPDGNAVGLTLQTNLTISGGTVQSVTVSMDITGGFNGDLYAYLLGPNGGYAVLLNRVGVGSGNSFGYSNTGFNVTFDDTILDSIHFYQNIAYSLNGSGQVTGTWQPDGENIDPQSSPSLFDAQTQDALLSSFDGFNPNGTWTLFLADLSGGGQSMVANWGLDIVTVPEPSAPVLAFLGFTMVFLVRLYQRRRLQVQENYSKGTLQREK